MNKNFIAELKELRNEQKKEEGLVLSLFLNLSYPNDFRQELNSLIHRKKKQLKELDTSRERKKTVEKLFDKLEGRVEKLNRAKEKKLFVCFCGSDFWKEYHLPISVPSKLIIEPVPYIRPLYMGLEQFKRYHLVVSDQKEAKLLTYYGGEVQEKENFSASDAEDQVSLSYSDKESGGSLKGQEKATQRYGGSWPDSKVQHRINDHRHHFLKMIALKLFNKLQDKEMDRYLLAGPRGEEGKSVSRLKDHLHSYVEERTIGSFEGEPEMPDSNLIDELRKVIEDYEKSQEKKLLKHLLGEARRSSGLGVLGMEETLRALRNAQVKTLVVKSDSERSGWICPEDYYLSATQTNCPECDGNLKVTEDILGHMIWEAVDQRSEVRMIKTDPEDEFREYDVGALLRFRK
ncbi:hypothetical protein K9M78_00640 [Candidatus Bipolaricaulota bacterium]|nr:hypothetical protein [Candidatus Bipolaricaulota bacterium]